MILLKKDLQNLKQASIQNNWNKVLGFQRPKPHGGQFKGGQCVKMLDNIHILESLIMSVTEDEKLKALVESLKELKSVKDSCFGIQLAHDY